MLYSKGVKKTADLYMLVIGINNYKNPKYQLNYALADALAFKNEIETGSHTIFDKTVVTYLTDTQASKQGIIQAFNNIKDKGISFRCFHFLLCRPRCNERRTKVRVFHYTL